MPVFVILGMLVITGNFASNIFASAQSCTFNFSSGPVITVQEGITQTVTFELSSTNCDNAKNRVVEVKNQNTTLCSVSSAFSSTFNEHCNCTATERGQICYITDMFYRNNSERTVRVVGSGIPFVKVPIDVAYPTKLTKFGLTEPQLNPLTAVNSDSYADLRCYFEDGNPIREIIISDYHGMVLRNLPTPGNREKWLQHFIRPLYCNHSGMYRCEAKGEQQHGLNATILVKCPPVITDPEKVQNKSAVVGGEIIVKYDVLSYTATMSCKLSPPSSHSTRGSPDHSTSASTQDLACNSLRCQTNFFGEPPNFRLEVQLKDISERDQGEWTMAISNGYTGQGFPNVPNPAVVRFHVNVIQPTTTPPETTPTTPLTTSPSHVSTQGKQTTEGLPQNIVIAVSASVFIIVVIVITVIYLKVCRKPKESVSSQRKRPRPVPEIRYSRDDDQVMIVNDIYGSSPAKTGHGNAFPESDNPAFVPASGTQAKPSAAQGEEEAMYTDAAEVRKNKDKKRKSKDTTTGKAAQSEEGAMYTDASEVRKNKGKQKKSKDKTTGKAAAPEDQERMLYTDAADVRKKKEKQRVKKENQEEQQHAGGKEEPIYHNTDSDNSRPNAGVSKSDGAEEGQAEVAAVTNADGLTYGQLDFSHFAPRQTTITALPNTDYAQIDFKNSAPPRPPK